MHVHHFTEAPDLLGLTPAFLGSLRSFLVVGDPLCATTHTDLWLRARPRTDGLSPLGNHGKSSCGEKRVGIPIDFAGKRTLPFRCSTMHRCLAQLLRSSCWEQQQIWCHWLDLLELWRNLPYLQKPFFFSCVFFFPTRKYGFPVKFPEKQSNKTAKQQVGHGMALSNSFSTRG